MRFDWDDLRYFLAIARHGTLTAAARALAVSQPTMGRRLDAFEARLGARLFRRTPSGYLPTPAARTLLAHAERMEAEALGAARAVAGRDTGLEGEVRVTATETFASHVLAPLLAVFRARYPGILIEMVSHGRRLSLPRHEADLALRMARFEHQEVVQRRVAKVAFAAYASRAYLEARGRPDFARGAEGHDLILMTEEDAPISDVRWMRNIASGARLVARCNTRLVVARLCVEGVGLACLPRYLGDASPALVLLSTPEPTPDRAVWLGVHRDSRDLPRLRALSRFLVGELGALAPMLAPPR